KPGMPSSGTSKRSIGSSCTRQNSSVWLRAMCRPHLANSSKLASDSRPERCIASLSRSPSMSRVARRVGPVPPPDGTGAPDRQGPSACRPKFRPAIDRNGWRPLASPLSRRTPMAHAIRIGVDLGGTKTEVIALAADGREIYRKRTATPSGDYAAQIALVVRLVAELEQAVGAAGTVGIGIPGAISPATGLIKNANSSWLIGKPLDRDLAAALGRPVRLQNDANCLAVSEATDGAAAGCDVVFAVILGTGVGGGIVVRGWPLTGRNAIAGEWGHTQLAWRDASERPGPACYCGLHGCIETLLSGPGLAADYRAATGGDFRGETIVARAAA